MAETDVVYVFRAEDQISGPMKKAEEQLNRTEEASNRCTESQERAEEQLNRTEEASNRCTESQERAEEQLNRTAEASSRCTVSQEKAILKSVETLAALQALQSGLSAITSSVKTLGIVDEETALTLQKVTAGIQLVVGTAQAIKGVVTLFQTLNTVLKTTAIVSTFASIAENPVKGGLILGAAGLAAGGVAGYLYSVTQNNYSKQITVAHTETARQADATTETGTWY